jgi:predicted DNA-binding protein YlxM (UPF0122 family)
MGDGRINHGHMKIEDLQNIVRRRWITKVILDWRYILKGRQQQVVDMYYNDGLSQVEIARRLGIAQKNVSVYLSRAYKAISKRMKAYIMTENNGFSSDMESFGFYEPMVSGDESNENRDYLQSTSAESK